VSGDAPMIVGGSRGVDLAVIDNFDEIVHLVQHPPSLFIRYSEGPERDLEGPSVDYESGLTLPGLSVTPLIPPPWWTRPAREWVARRMCKYANLMQAPRQPQPWLLVGREVGLGPDHEPLIAEATPIAWVGPVALAEAKRIYHQRFTIGRDACYLSPRPTAERTGVASSIFGVGDSRCPFCFPAAIAPNQLLATTEHFYLLAPVGQIVEGFLGIMTHVCQDTPVRLRCLDDIPASWVKEMNALRDMVTRFYRDVYRAPALFYEHGRGGGHDSSLPGGDFAFHPHLCALPGDLDIHEPLQARFLSRRAPQFPALRAETGRRPYIYVHTPGGRHREPLVYYALDERPDESIRSLSIKTLLVEVNSLNKDSNWRRYPGERELLDLVERFNAWYAAGFRRQSDPRLGMIC
jgi:hypothetical protein